jgi:hypothetical protein
MEEYHRQAALNRQRQIELEAESRRDMSDMEQLVNLQSRRLNDRDMRELETLLANRLAEDEEPPAAGAPVPRP